MDECVKDINDDKNEIYDGEKDAECLDDTSPNETKEVLSDIKDEKN